MKDLLSIIIVTFNNAKTINDCLRSIERSYPPPHEIICIDNASTDSTVQILMQSKIKTTLIKNDQNLGFSKANNIGVKHSQGDLLLFLNPDTEILNDMTPLIVYLNEHPEVGVIAPQLIENGKIQPSIRNLPTLIGTIREFIFKQKNSYNPFYLTGSQPLEVESVVGAAMMMRREIFYKIGGFDKKYFMYFEDLDLCRKIREHNLKVVYYPKVCFKHQVGVSAQANHSTRKYLENSAAIYHGIVKKFLIDLIIKSSRISH